VYKDPGMTRVIRENEKKIMKHQNEMKENLDKATKYVHEVNQDWNTTKDGSEKPITDVKTETDNIFESNNISYEDVLIKTTQMYHVLSSIIRYFQGIFVYRVSNSKMYLNVDEAHDELMQLYDKTYHNQYALAYQQLEREDYMNAINTARDTIQTYNTLTQYLDNYIQEHLDDVQIITEGCYQLKYNMDDQTCSRIFPNLNQSYVDMYPTIMKAINASDPGHSVKNT
jgi:hypothetical protein